MTELESLYRAYFRDVYLYILSLSKDEHIAEDITSEAFIKAIKSIDTFKGDCDIRVWLCQIAKNCYYSYLRKNKKIIYTDEEPEHISEINIEQSIVYKEDSIKIHEILHKLKEPYKEVFSLRIFSELSFKEIGYLFGKSENWACVTYHRARKKIQDEMEDY
ncbi:MAG: sigma-70 family RNA polymerase sigma factor [Eubacteriales bacterium]|nr:sigma-70 family RNA polymerase sigma factor [Eubacteriales bacterium]